MINIFIGFDPSQPVAYHACSNSIIRNSVSMVSITPLSLKSISGYDETHVDGSNQFIYSRFLTPYLMSYQGWAIFIDGDMILRADIAELWSMRDESKAVQVVKHNYVTRRNVKYLGSKNENYPRKNWSSVIIWNCAHPANRILNPSFVEKSTGAQLHRFSWLIDSDIGELPIEWNWLPDELGENSAAKLLHWTLGTPCFIDFATTSMAEEWHREHQLLNYCKQIDMS